MSFFFEKNQVSWAVYQWQKKITPKLKEKWNEVNVSKMSSIGNQAHTEIWETMKNEVGEPKDRCKWLKENAHRFDKTKVKATQKAWGCRHSRVGKDRKNRRKK